MPKAYPLCRAPDRLRGRDFDVLVIGGGIYGAWTAYDAALRGLSVALIEKDDWGSGTSSASSKLIHGGLRYLENFEFSLVHHALAERRVLTRIAPHLVRPLRFALPVYRGAAPGMLKLSAGLSLYDLMAGFDQPVASHRRYSPQAFARHWPFLSKEQLRGGFSYGDCQEDDARMTLAVVAAAQAAGAVCASRVEALKLLSLDQVVTGALVKDTLDGQEFSLKARVTVAAAGPWARDLLGEAAPRVRLIKGTHLLMPAIKECDTAFLLTAPQDGRVFFVIPWYARTLVGTTESEVSDPSQARASDPEVRYLLDAVNARLPGLTWTDGDIVGRFAGIRTLQAEPASSLSAVTREFLTLTPRPGLLLPLGGKYTTSRRDAVGIVDLVQRSLGDRLRASMTDRTPLPGAPEGPFGPWLERTCDRLSRAGVDPGAAHAAALRHGSRADELIDLCQQDRALAVRIDPSLPFILAEAVIAIRDENALSVEDVLRRRMPLTLLVRESAAAVEKVKLLFQAAGASVKRRA